MKTKPYGRIAALVLAFSCAPLALAATGNQTLTGTQQTQASHAKAAHSTQADAGYRNWTTDQMKDLQKALEGKGFHVKASGHWDDATRSAVKAFQEKDHLKPTGFPNSKTRKALGLDW